MTGYQSINFDGKTLKKISFGEYFSLNSAEDTNQMIQLITEKINRDGIRLSSLQNIDFNVEMDTISFNFDTYEIAGYASGTIRAKVEKKLLQRFIQKGYY
jgi:hypothetical protein